MAPFARLNAVVLDCPDPRKLAAFYGELTGWQVEYDEPEWVTLYTGAGLRICFQEAPDYQPPRWPDPTGPQQIHLDLAVGTSTRPRSACSSSVQSAPSTSRVRPGGSSSTPRATRSASTKRDR